MADIAPALGLPASETHARLAKIVVAHLGGTAEQVTADTDLAEDLNADSLDLFEIGMAAEEEFGIQLDDDEIAGFRTVGDAVKLIDQRTGRA